MSKRIEKLLVSVYKDKGTDFSSSQLTKNNYQLWVEYNAPKKDKGQELVGLSSFLGSAMHSAFEVQNLPGVVQELSYIKELNGYTIGGTFDRLDWNKDTFKWDLGDYKLKGDYSYRKFIEKNEREKEIMQLSIYRWLFKDLFNISEDATIFLFMLGHTGHSKHPAYQEVGITLWDTEDTERYLINKIEAATATVAPEFDCDIKWMCKYCNAFDSCPYQQTLKDAIKEENDNAFKDES